jgi:putative hydrolase of the HAD superfamily
MDDTSDLIEIIKRRARLLEPIPAGLKRRGGLDRPVKAVLFDVYGTLFMSAPGGPDAAGPRIETPFAAEPRSSEPAERVSDLLGVYGIDDDSASVLRRFRERVLYEHARMRKDGVDFPEVRVEEIWRNVLSLESLERARRFAVEYECLVNPVWPMPHAEALIEELRGAGFVLGIVSNAQFFTPLLFRAFFDAAELEMGFDERLVLYSYMHGRAKPSLSLFEKAREILLIMSIFPENVLFVGNDEENDIRPAFRTGFQTALFCGDLRSLRMGASGQEIRRRPPDLTVTSLEELSAALKYGQTGQDSSQRTS